jgi:tetrahydromethanopterin S-methyltransferase subunit A
VIRHYRALDRNDFDAANAAIHEDSPTGGELPQDAIDRASERSYTIDEVGEVDTDDDRTVVRVVFTETHDDSGASTTNELQIEVRQNGDVWKMWEILSFETLETTTAS